MEALFGGLDRFAIFFPLLVRVGAMFVSSPVFGGRGVPNLSKAAFAALVTFLLLPATQPIHTFPETVPGYFVVILKELAVGLLLGYTVTLVFMAAQIAGQLMDVPLGFGMVNVIDPQMGTQLPILAQFQYILALLIFLSLNGHHVILMALAHSVQVVPIGEMVFDQVVSGTLISTFSTTFFLGVTMALPVLGAAFLTDVAMGMIARAIPQINVFVTGFPVKIIAGLLALAVALPAYVALIGRISGVGGTLAEWLWRLIGGTGGA